jgi:hypothetical protein
VFCQGWYPLRDNGRYMSERHAPLWVHGFKGMTFEGSEVQPRIQVQHGPAGWDLVTVDVPFLVHVPGEKRRVGPRLLAVRQ